MSDETHTQTNRLSVKDAYDIYHNHSTGTHKLWTYFVTLSLAILGYTIGTAQNHWDLWTFVVVGSSYFIAAWVNRSIVLKFQKEVETFALLFNQLAREYPPQISTQKPIIGSIAAVSYTRARLSHWGITLFVLAAILSIWWQNNM